MYAEDAPLAQPLRDVMLARLQASTTWLDRHALSAGASSSNWAIDDALADLVLERLAVYRQGKGYRLALPSSGPQINQQDVRLALVECAQAAIN